MDKKNKDNRINLVQIYIKVEVELNISLLKFLISMGKSKKNI